MTDSSRASFNRKSTGPVQGLDPVALLDAVIGTDPGDWQPPQPEILEAAFQGFDDFVFINRGGMGAVYAARQKSLDRKVAIKILPSELGHDRNFVDRFHQEARLLAKLQHPNIVTIYDFGATGAGHLFIVMEYVQGTSLQDLMKGQRLSVVTTLEIVCQVCDALQFAHEHGVIHRDIKPTNILVDDRGKVRVADFGLAKIARANPASTLTSHTQEGRAIGTPGYASPEQRRAEPEVDGRADIFSLGVTLYEMLTGELPVGVFQSPSRKAGSPPALDRVVFRALQEKRELRYQTIVQMKKAIEPIATKIGAPGFRRRLLQRPLTAAVIFMQLLITGWLLYGNFIKPQAAPAETSGAPSFFETSRPMPLTGRFALFEEATDWYQAREIWSRHPDYRLARIHNAEEQKALFEALKNREVSFAWLGGHLPKGKTQFEWADGSPLRYEAWEPAHKDPPVIITEIQAKNQTTLRNSSGDTCDWVELYNPGNEPVDIKHWRFVQLIGSRGAEAWLKSKGGASTVIAPKAYQVIFFGMRRPGPAELAIPFPLEASGAMLRWYDARGNIIQDFQRPWPPFAPDVSIGCAEDGSDWGVCEAPTPGAPNRPRISSIPPPSSTNERAMAIMMVTETGGAWTMQMAQRKAWVVLEKTH